MGGHNIKNTWHINLFFLIAPQSLFAATPDIAFSYLEFGAIIGLGIAIYVASLLDCKRRTKGRFQHYQNLLESHPEGWCLWDGYKAYENSTQFRIIFDYLKSNTFSLSDFLIHLEGESARQLESAFQDLVEKNHSFLLRIQCGHKNATYLIKGAGLDSHNQIVTWVRNVTDQEHNHKIFLEGAHKNERMLETLEALLNTLPCPIWHRNSDLKIDYCNRAYEEAVGTNAKSIIDDQIELLNKLQSLQFAQEAIETNQVTELKTSIIVGDEKKHYILREVPDVLSGGTFGFAKDIDNEERLSLEKEELLHAHHEILDHLSTAVAIYDGDRRLAYYNRAYLKMNGLEEKLLKGNPRLDEVLEILRERRAIPEYADFPAYKKSRIKQFQDLIKPHEEMIHRPDERTLRMFTAPYPLGGLIFMFEDVTDNLTLERKNHALMETQRATLDNLFEGVAVFGPDNKLTLSNVSFARIWSLTPEQCAPGRHLREIVEDISPFFTQEDDWGHLKSRIIENTTDRILKSGQILRSDNTVIEFNYVPLPNGDNFLSYTDITATYRIEEALRLRNEALEAADKTKSEFIANVSYELRAPLNTIIGFSEILQNRYFGELNPRQEDYVKGVLDSSMNLLKLINDILDLASIEAGYMKIEPQEFSVQDLIMEVIQLLNHRIESNQLALEVKCHKSAKFWISDSKRVKQALFNLLSNAINYTPPGGKIILKAEVVDDELMIAVIDNGVGIAVEDHERVFRKFERGKSLKKGNSGGAGLGLSLVKSLIELHGGRVELKSQLKKGTTVMCYLPQSCEIPKRAA